MAVSTTWVRDNYDTNKSRYIDSAEVSVASDDHSSNKITQEQFDAVMAAWQNNTLLPAYGTVKEAKGLLVNFNYPTSSKTSERISIRAAVRNTGNASGNFKLQLFKGSTRVTQSTTFSVAAGQTSSSRSMYISTPSSGASVSYQIRCVRIT